MKRGPSRAEAADDVPPAPANGTSNGATEPPGEPERAEDSVLRRAKAIERAKALVARAAHPNTPEEEARTTALIAAREIQKNRLLDPAPRHPIIDRLEGLSDDMLDSVAGLLEDLLSDWPADRRSAPRSTPVMLDLVRWRNEARAVTQRLQLHVFSLRAVLATGRIGLADEVGRCEACPRPIIVGEMIAWRRRRREAIHYLCYVDNLSRRTF